MRPSHPRFSIIAYWASAALIVASAFLYYPKWQQTDTEATLSWDVSGYYFYLPAFLIYDDARELAWRDSIFKKYKPTPDLQQAFRHEPSGHFVMKYPLGQALQMLPWFGVAHALAEPLGYPADGFSRPYQAAIAWGSLLVALVGLWYLRRVLLHYFSEAATAATLLCVAWGTNYLNYTAFDGAMTHNWLFTLYSLLIFNTIRFYERPTVGRAWVIGALVGWATLTRPTEILSVLIPLLWGWEGLRARFSFFKKNALALGCAALGMLGMVSLQFAYWRYAGGEWVIYSYEKQTFDWLRPHIADGLISFKAGWLVYTPMMALAVVGLWPLWRQHRGVCVAVLAFVVPFMYVTWAWQIWWYGGSLGQRAMVQSYPLWAMGLAGLWEWVRQWRWGGAVLAVVAGACLWHNLWWTHQAHRGGLYVAEQMTKPYWLAVYGRDDASRDLLKLLDTKDEQYPRPKRPKLRPLLTADFEADTTAATTTEAPIGGQRSLMLTKDRQTSPELSADYTPSEQHRERARWVRATCTFRCDDKEWDFWRMTQMVVRAYDGDKKVTERFVRLQRHVDGNEPKTLWFDTRLPPGTNLSRCVVLFWNGESEKTVRIDDVRMEVF
jgi:hypothetical protein